MKKILLFSFAVLAFAASCQKPQNDLFEPDPLDDGTPVKVMLGTNVLNATARALVLSSNLIIQFLAYSPSTMLQRIGPVEIRSSLKTIA